MDSSEEPTSLQSICHLRASELFPKHKVESEDPTLTIPFNPLSGESVLAIGRTSEGVLALSNYRLYLQLNQSNYNIPLGLIEQLEVKEIFYLHISCKNALSLSCAFSTNEHCLEWFKRLHKLTYPRKNIEDIFAFAHYAWCIEEGKDHSRLAKDHSSYTTTFQSEMERLKFNLHGTWRISQINLDYKMCPSYPPQLLVPACINDEILEIVAKFRSSRRIPAVVWRHINNGAVIARSSQPEVGWLGWRSTEDEDLLKALSDACSYDRGESTIIDPPNPNPNHGYSDSQETNVPAASTTVNKKVLIVDARSYTTAVANRARGGGCECPEYYPNCDIQFMNLPNIHSIRKSFHAVRQLCASDSDQPNWLSLLEGTRWLQHMSGLLRAAVTVASAIERDGRPVLVHCSDGWDRTPQIVALAQLLLDPYYRTIEGFQILCEREWLDFGHKFADRCGQTVGCDDPNERCPVFLQWLDCVHQLIHQYPCSFQMSPEYIVKLAQHTYSQFFGTFLCNNRQERLQLRLRDRTFSVWRFLNSNSFVNYLYSPSKNQVLWPSCNIRDLVLWSEVYLGSMVTTNGENKNKRSVRMIDIEGGEGDEPQSQMTKTRSYGDLIQAQDHNAYPHRRLSDPSITLEKKFDSMNFENNDNNKVEKNLSNVENDDDNDDDDDSIETVDNNDDNISEVNYTVENLIITRRDDYKAEINNGDSPLTNTSVDSSTDTLIPNTENINGGGGSGSGSGSGGKATDVENYASQRGNNTSSEEPTILTNWSESGNNHHHHHHHNNVRNNNNNNCNNCNNRGQQQQQQDHSSEISDISVALFSRTPSSVCPASPIHHQDIVNSIDISNDKIDDIDGMPVICSDIQMRLQQLSIEHKLKCEALQKELHTNRMALIKQVCNHNNDTDRIDDIGSLPDSVESAGEHGESIPSDMSWEAVEDLGPAPVLWVPDHAVNRCMGCDTEFWLGRRKHHCRGCGKIFCADCSENSTPLPSEQLYNPVRVCSDCFSRLHHHVVSPCQHTKQHHIKLNHDQDNDHDNDHDQDNDRNNDNDDKNLIKNENEQLSNAAVDDILTTKTTKCHKIMIQAPIPSAITNNTATTATTATATATIATATATAIKIQPMMIKDNISNNSTTTFNPINFSSPSSFTTNIKTTATTTTTTTTISTTIPTTTTATTILN